ncbi:MULTISPECIES: hypothetical protein [unclassified Meiothermus]|uniref:hypothetical protein n=1 Tax=unclassified Meiothermus TaxID=370471 RepID=UPI000D7C26DB|nr:MULTISPECIES: hypothetical protein [unclassified Meiothermus]PZA07770.1 hypothetical protein DNA98_05540 [Meiothermus sp. Pnk-1]RYM38930.1 hypothetical protein EWH23_04155 [Meiothermus sp. PNK-Is4]
MIRIKRNNIPYLNDQQYYLSVAYDPRQSGWVGLVWCICMTRLGDDVQPYYTVYHVPQYVFPTAEEARQAINAAFPELRPVPPMEEWDAPA